jgi:hypothetical protein
VLLGLPLLVLPPLDPQAAAAIPNAVTSTTGASRRAIVRRTGAVRVVISLSSLTRDDAGFQTGIRSQRGTGLRCPDRHDRCVT